MFCFLLQATYLDSYRLHFWQQQGVMMIEVSSQYDRSRKANEREKYKINQQAFQRIGIESKRIFCKTVQT